MHTIDLLCTKAIAFAGGLEPGVVNNELLISQFPGRRRIPLLLELVYPDQLVDFQTKATFPRFVNNRMFCT